MRFPLELAAASGGSQDELTHRTLMRSVDTCLPRTPNSVIDDAVAERQASDQPVILGVAMKRLRGFERHTGSLLDVEEFLFEIVQR